MLSCRQYYGGRTATVKNKTRDFFAWTINDVELLLKVTHEKVVVCFLPGKGDVTGEGYVVMIRPNQEANVGGEKITLVSRNIRI